MDDSIQVILNDFDSAPDYHTSLDDYKPSPLISLPHLASELGLGEIWVKNEAERFGVPAIKLLGASFALHKLLQADR